MELEQLDYFCTPIYLTKNEELLPIVKQIALDNLKNSPEPNEIYPVRMSTNMLLDQRIGDFAEFIGKTTWGILDSQGFNLDGFDISITELWCQEHWRTSSMDQHIHANGNHIVGFYFLDVPENAPPAIFYDPRPSRLMVDLPQRDEAKVTHSSTLINIRPEAGLLIFAPAWLAHSFARNISREPFRFVHFNLTAQPKLNQPVCEAAEVI